MSDIPLSELIGSNNFISDGFLTQSIPNGTLGDVTITCPTGKKILLTSMWSGTAKTNISVTFGSRLIIDDMSLVARSDTEIQNGEFCIGGVGLTSNIRYIEGRTGEDLIINFGVITVSNAVEVAYMVGT